MLDGLPGKIAEIQSYQAGIDVVRSARVRSGVGDGFCGFGSVGCLCQTRTPLARHRAQQGDLRAGRVGRLRILIWARAARRRYTWCGRVHARGCGPIVCYLHRSHRLTGQATSLPYTQLECSPESFCSLYVNHAKMLGRLLRFICNDRISVIFKPDILVCCTYSNAFMSVTAWAYCQVTP